MPFNTPVLIILGAIVVLLISAVLVYFNVIGQKGPRRRGGPLGPPL